MSREDIRKLLGGYATGTLTESERRALFEAALDDQELFNALQQEQALKSFLDDPEARVQLRQALERQSSGKAEASRKWWWIWTGAAGAVAAALLFAVLRSNPTPGRKQTVEVASLEKSQTGGAPAQATTQTGAAVPETKESTRAPIKTASGRVVKRTAPSADTVVPPEQADAPAAAAPPVAAPPKPQSVQSFRQQEAKAQAAGQAQNRVALTSMPAAKAALRESILRYSLLKHGPDNNFAPASAAELQIGDLVRLEVSATQSGQLTLSRRGEAGQWQHVADLAVQANSAYKIPETPIQVTAAAQTYRLTLAASGAQPQIVGGIGGVAPPILGAGVPAMLDITISARSGN